MSDEVIVAELGAELEARWQLLRESRHVLGPLIVDVGLQASAVLERAGVIYSIGNGGSAAQAQHLAAELVGRYRRERPPLRAFALTADTSLLTAVGNDYGFESVFRRQVEAHVTAADMLIALSTSGNSPNVVAAARAAKQRGALTVGLVGGGGGVLAKEVDRAIVVPSVDTAQIQELHLTVIHLLCAVIDRRMSTAR